MTSSDLLRLCMNKLGGLAWVTAIGFSEWRMASSEVRSPTWLTVDQDAGAVHLPHHFPAKAGEAGIFLS
jgi:putative AlgH/UPF0301 family transcriptional regulator